MMLKSNNHHGKNKGPLVVLFIIMVITYYSQQATSFTIIAKKPSTTSSTSTSSCCTSNSVLQVQIKPSIRTTQRNQNQRNNITILSASNNRINNNNNNKAEEKNQNQNQNQKPTNEFSRQIRTEIILSPRSSKRQYNTNISATNDELTSLAKRFSLSKITKLDASLSLTKDTSRSSTAASRSSTNNGECIIVTGNVYSKVTQTCVRTNEDFDIDLDFSIYSIVRAVDLREVRQRREERSRSMCSGGGGNTGGGNTGDEDLGGMSLSQIEEQLGGGGGGYKKNSKRKKRGVRGGGGGGGNNGLNDFNMKEIENLLQEFDTEDDIFEDENVMGSDGMLDVGELVSQMFRLKLDPYPKKPGSEPVRYSISG